MDVGSFSLFVISNTKTATVRSRIMDMVTQKIAERLFFSGIFLHPIEIIPLKLQRPNNKGIIRLLLCQSITLQQP